MQLNGPKMSIKMNFCQFEFVTHESDENVNNYGHSRDHLLYFVATEVFSLKPKNT